MLTNKTALRLSEETISRLKRLTNKLNVRDGEHRQWSYLGRLLVERGLVALERRLGLGGEK
jgi:predicted DNA-binding protein